MSRGETIDNARFSIAWILQELIESELTATIGAGRGRRSASNTTQRRGQGTKLLLTAPGDVGVGIQKAAHKQLLPLDLGAPLPDQPGFVCCSHGGLRARRVNPLGG